MRHFSVRLVFTFLLLSGALLANETSLELRNPTTGFYPIFENTGYVERQTGDAYFGTHSGHVGLLGRFIIGVEPIYFVYRNPNAYVKALLWDSPEYSLSAQVTVFHLLEGASRSSFSPMYVSRLDNPDFSVTLVPVALSGTYRVQDIVDIHHTLTVLGVFSTGAIRSEGFTALSLAAEFLPRARHGLVLHWTDVGIWNHDLTVLGASYRYRNTWFEGRVGYFYRFRKAGDQAGPMMSFGFLL